MRLTYTQRRLRTPAGRRETWRWGMAIGWLALVVTLALMLWRRGWMVSEWRHVQAAWEVLLGGQISEEVVSLVITVALVMCLPSLVLAVRLSVRLRPWRPHSGGMNLTIPTVRLSPPGAETWRFIGQQRLLERFADADLAPPGPPMAVPGMLGGPAPPPATVSEETGEVDPPAGTGDAVPSSEKAKAEMERLVSASDNEMVAAGKRAVSSMPSTTVVLPPKKSAPAGPEVKIFRLFKENPNMREERASVVLLFAMHNEAIENADVAQVCRIRRDRVRSLLWRLEKEGWLQRAGTAKYKWGKYATTDLGLLIGAVKTGKEEAAATVAATIRTPLPGLDADWITSEMWTLRRSLRTAATETLEAARERWPHNEVFTSALHNITEKAQQPGEESKQRTNGGAG